MGIRFSPGPCGCCELEYVCYFKAIDVFQGGSQIYQIEQGVQESQSFASTLNGQYAVIVSNADLMTDVFLGNVFQPPGLGLPLNGQLTKGRFDAEGNNPELLTGVLKAFFSAPVSVTITVEFGLYALQGGKGNWTILGHAIKTTSDNAGGTGASFIVAANGTIT